MSDKKLHIEDELKEAVTIGLLVELIEKLKGEKEQLQEVVSGSTIHQAIDADRMDEQVKILREIQDKGFNIITCGLCGEVNLVRLANKMFECYVCSEKQQHHDCADLFF